MIDSSTTKRAKKMAPWLALLVVPTLLISCSNNDSEGGAKKQGKEKSGVSECKGVDIDKDDLPADCADALFTSRIDQAKSKELRGVRQEKILSIGHGVCALASAVSSDPTQAAGFDDMIKTNSKNWGISEASAREAIDIAQVLCPDDMAKLLQLTQDQKPVTVVLKATGSGKVMVTYTGTDDDKADSAVDPPWSKELKVSKPGPVTLSVFPSSAAGVSTGCEISVDGVQVAKSTGADGQMAICRVAEGQMRAAGAGQLAETATTAAPDSSDGAEG